MGERYFEEHEEYHDLFYMYSPKTQTKLTDVIEVHTIEIPKLPQNSDGTTIWDWVKFIKADSKEELAMLVQNSPQMQGAVNTLLEINQDAQARREFEYREKQRRDAVSRERRMKREGIQEGERNKQLEIARNMIKRKMAVSDIMDITGLTATEMNELL